MGRNMAKRVIIDTDPGIDDAMALDDSASGVIGSEDKKVNRMSLAPEIYNSNITINYHFHKM